MVCAECAWLRPLVPGYTLDRSVFLWAQDGQAMTKLQSISALHTAAKSISEKVGRPWIESTFNGIRLGPKQFPDIWIRAVLAARILGLPKMPDVYISGDSQWNTYTYGTDTSAFVVLGTAILNNFQNDDLLFVLAREMGHCRAGHALWKTVARFLAGDDSVHKGVLSGGVLSAISLSPTKWIQDAVDFPLMAWSRQADITADRAALLAIGDEALARRVLLAWSIRSSRLLKQVNIDEWMKQEEGSDDQMTRFSEMTTSASMYTTRRLRLLGQAAREPDLMRWSQSIQPIRKRLTPAPQPPISGLTAAAPVARRPLPTPRPGHGGWPGSWFCTCGCGSFRTWPGVCARGGSVRLRSRDLQQMPGSYADSSCRFARQDVAQCPLSEMPKHLYDSAQTRFWGARFAGGGYSGANCRGTNKSTQTAGVSLRLPRNRLARRLPTAAAQAKPSAATLPASKLSASKLPATSQSEKTKSPTRPSVVVAPHKHAK